MQRMAAQSPFDPTILKSLFYSLQFLIILLVCNCHLCSLPKEVFCQSQSLSGGPQDHQVFPTP